MAKQSISITLSEDLVERIDSEARKKDVNRSQMIEEMIRGHMQSQGLDTAVVFCGDPENKSMNEMDGEPVLSHVIESLNDQVSRIILLVGPNQEEVEEHFGSMYEGTALEYISDSTSGTAAALNKVSEKIGGTFLAVNGHVVSDVDVDEMLETHREEARITTMALTTVETPSEYGVARLKGRRILGFEEKPNPGEEPSRLINAGTYIFEKEIFDQLDRESLEEVFEELAEKGELSGYIYGGKWKYFS